MKLNKCHINSNRDGHFFGNRVINALNSLSDDIVTSPTVACFKSRIVELIVVVFLFCGALVSAVSYCLCVLST